MPKTDAELVRESRAGRAQSFGLLVERYQRLVRAVALSASGNPATAEELAQEAFVTAWTRLHDLREPDHFGSWVCGMARNLAHYARRHQARHAPAANESAERLANLPLDTPSPLDTAIERQEQAVLAQALNRIPESYREPLVLFYGEDRSIAEVAGHLGLSRDTVKQRLSRGRRYLERGVQELLRGTLARPAGVSAAVLATIASLPRAHAIVVAGANLQGLAASGSSSQGLGHALAAGFASSAKLALGSVLAASITLAAFVVLPSADRATPRVTMPAADLVVPAAPEAAPAPGTPALQPSPSPAAAPDIVAPAESEQTTEPAPAHRRTRVTAGAPAQVAVPDPPGADETATVIEFGPTRVSVAHAGPSLSLHDALSIAEAHEPESLAANPPGWRLPIEPPDLAARILDLDI